MFNLTEFIYGDKDTPFSMTLED